MHLQHLPVVSFYISLATAPAKVLSSFPAESRNSLGGNSPKHSFSICTLCKLFFSSKVILDFGSPQFYITGDLAWGILTPLWHLESLLCLCLQNMAKSSYTKTILLLSWLLICSIVSPSPPPHSQASRKRS